MLSKGVISYLRLASGAFGVASIFLPWLVSEYYGYVSLWYPPLFSPPFIQPWNEGLRLEALTSISLILTVTLACLIWGCVAAFLSSFNSALRGRWLAFSGGIAYSLAPTIFVFGTVYLLSVFGSELTRTPFASSIVSSGFLLAFAAAALSFISLSNLRNMAFFVLTWGIVAVFVALFFLFTYRTPSYSLVFISSLFSLIIVSLATLVYGLYSVLKNRFRQLTSAKPGAH